MSTAGFTSDQKPCWITTAGSGQPNYSDVHELIRGPDDQYH